MSESTASGIQSGVLKIYELRTILLHTGAFMTASRPGPHKQHFFALRNYQMSISHRMTGHIEFKTDGERNVDCCQSSFRQIARRRFHSAHTAVTLPGDTEPRAYANGS